MSEKSVKMNLPRESLWARAILVVSGTVASQAYYDRESMDAQRSFAGLSPSWSTWRRFGFPTRMRRSWVWSVSWEKIRCVRFRTETE